MPIATLIAAGRLDDRLIDRAIGLLREVDPAANFGAWIDEGDAADLRFTGDLKVARWALEQLPGTDVVVQADEPRFRRLLVADMDSTIIGQECIDELADFAGLKREIALITERAMRGELDFKDALAERVRPNPGAKTLVQTMRAGGATCLLISGGFTAFAEPVAREVGFDRVRANRLGMLREQLSGEVEGEIVDAAVKRQALVDAREELGLNRADAMALGDGANDRPMIQEAGLGIAYRAKPVLAEAADARLDHHRLDALLWAQGIRKREWYRRRS